MKDYLLNLNIILSSLTIYSEIKNIRNKNKSKKNDKNLISNLKKGDNIITIGGIIGEIKKIENELITILINNENTIIIHNSAILNIL